MLWSPIRTDKALDKAIDCMLICLYASAYKCGGAVAYKRP
jgi:hypothetical protein